MLVLKQDSFAWLVIINGFCSPHLPKSPRWDHVSTVASLLIALSHLPQCFHLRSYAPLEFGTVFHTCASQAACCNFGQHFASWKVPRSSNLIQAAVLHSHADIIPSQSFFNPRVVAPHLSKDLFNDRLMAGNSKGSKERGHKSQAGSSDAWRQNTIYHSTIILKRRKREQLWWHWSRTGPALMIRLILGSFQALQ